MAAVLGRSPCYNLHELPYLHSPVVAQFQQPSGLRGLCEGVRPFPLFPFPLPLPLPFLGDFRVPPGERGVAPPLRVPPGVRGVFPDLGVPLGPLKRPGAALRGVDFLTLPPLGVVLGLLERGVPGRGVDPRRLLCFVLQVAAAAPAQTPPL